MPSDLRADFVLSLSSRLEQILPIRSGFNLAEVELNAQYILTTNLYFANCRDPPANGSRSFMAYILELLVQMLEKLNIDPTERALKKQRDDRTLTLTLVLTKLLAALVRFRWDKLRLITHKEERLTNLGINFNYDLRSPTDCMHLYAQLPPQAVEVDVHHIMEVLLSLLSEDYNREALASIRRQDPKRQTHLDYQLSPRTEILPELARSLVHDIDSYILVVLRFLAVANSADYYSFLSRKLFAWLERGEYIPTASLQRYAPLLKFVYTTVDNVDSYSRQIYSTLPNIRSDTWKQLFLYYESENLKYQSFYRPDFYSNVIAAGGPSEQSCKQLFDFVSTIFEDQPAVSPSLFTWFILTCPSDFDEVLQKPNKLKQAFNKRVKYLTTLLKDSQANVGLDCFESLINIFQLGLRNPDVTGGVREFTLRYLDQTYLNLRKIRSKCRADGNLDRYVSLLVKFLIAAIAIKPELYIDEFIDLYKNYVVLPENDCKDECVCGFARLTVKVLKGLSEYPQYKSSFRAAMGRLHKTMRQMLIDAYLRLREYEIAHPSWSTPSSILTNHADKHLAESDKPLLNSPLSHALRKNLDYGIGYVNDMPTEDLPDLAEASATMQNIYKTPYETGPSVEYELECIKVTEDILSDLMLIFSAAPEHFMMAQGRDEGHPFEGDDLTIFAEEISAPLRLAIRFKSVNGNSDLFEAACALAMTLVEADKPQLRDTDFKECASFVLSHYIIKAISEACTLFSLTDPKFKLCFIFLNKFLQERDQVYVKIRMNKFLDQDWAHPFCASVCVSVEIILLLAMCTHDVQFFGMAKITMNWYLVELKEGNHPAKCRSSTLYDTFRRVLDDESVFTGFVSLHKKFRSILMDADPTTSLFHVWLLIYQRWLDMIDGDSKVSDDSVVFRHYTGFLVTTSGCFLDPRFSKDDDKEKEKAASFISSFFDRAIGLLNSSELVIRVVVKDALSYESHSAVFHLVCNKLMNSAVYFIEQDSITDEGILFVEQLMTIVTAMVNIDNDGSFALVALLPDVCQFLIKFINMVTSQTDYLKLKLRFCKLGHAVENNRVKNGIDGAYKLRNIFAKASAEWLEQAIFHKAEETDTSSDLPSVLSSPLSTTPLHKSTEIEYLQIEFASECAKCLELQLQNLILEVPDGTKEKNIKQSKDLIFSNYFSLFYKIIQKHTSATQSLLMLRSKYKVQSVTESVLNSISNLLQSDSQIGMQFVIPLGYHENKKIRSIFLNIFASMLSSRKLLKSKDEFPDEIVQRMSEVYEVYGAAAEVASPAEYNLLATSLYGLFGYTKRLDKLFMTLLQDEIGNVSRSSDIFRRNSTLTRLMSLFAKEYGLPYLTVVLKPFIEDLVDQDFSVEVEKSSDEATVDAFMHALTTLIDTIVNSMIWVPDSFKFIASEIDSCIRGKFEAASLVAVGSFIFLRFFCPAIISPESFFDMPPLNPKVKRSLMQLVKVLQYIANGSLGMLKWPGLQGRSEELESLNKRIFNFLQDLAHSKSKEPYPFHRLTLKPYTNLRYLHKYLYVYFINIKHRFILGDPLAKAGNLHERVLLWRKLDAILKELGDPKSFISLQGTTSYKAADVNNNLGNTQYSEFMAKMSAKNIEMTVDVPIIHSAVFHDGTPVVVVNFRYIKDIGYDISTFVYLILEAASQVWDNKFYLVNDFTQFFYMGIIGRNYVSLMRNYAPGIFFNNCARSYYFNLPRANYLNIIRSMVGLRIDEHNTEGKIYFYSQEDDPSDINKLCLEESTVGINHDIRVVYKDCLLYDDNSQTYIPVTIKLGRQWLQICFEKFDYDHYYTVTKSVTPVETHLLSDLTKCEISNRSKRDNEFTLSLNKYNYEVTIISPQRQDILRFLYFAMLRNSRKVVNLKGPEDSKEENSLWFGRLYNIVFHGLLDFDEDVRSSASNLFAALSVYYDTDFGISNSHAKLIAYPVDTTEFVVSVSTYLAKEVPERTFRFLKAFFNNFLKLPHGLRISGIMYASPWVDNVGDQVLTDTDGPAKVAEIIRQFSRITVQNKSELSFLNEHVWKKLFSELRLTSILMDELIAYLIENKSECSEWDAIISVISPSVELCGEVVSRLIECIRNTRADDSEIASQTKLLEITVLVKVCASLFFNSYVYGTLYLPDVFFFCTLFIDSPTLNFGSDLQKLVINSIQSFSHKPDLTEKQSVLIDETINYFSGQRARMLFGLTSRERQKNSDYNQFYNRSTSFERLCDYLNDFMFQMGSADDRTKWMTRWSSLSMDIAFSNSFYKKRAILAVSTFARSGISDATSGRIIKLLGEMMFDDFETYTNAGICYTRIEEGLKLDSVYLPLIVWSQMARSLIRISSSYQAIATCVTNVVCKGSHSLGYQDRIYEQRNQLEPLFTKFEERVKVRITRRNFEFRVFFTICSGLTVTQFRHTSISCLKKIVKQKFAKEGQETLVRCNLDVYYLFMLSLSLSNSDLNEFMEEIELPDDSMTNVGKFQFPTVVLDRLLDGSELSKMTFILAAHIFAKDCDSVYTSRFITLYSCIFKTARKMALFVFHIVKVGLEKNMVKSTSIETVNGIAELMVDVIHDSAYSPARTTSEVNNILDLYDFQDMETVGNFVASGDEAFENKFTKALAKLVHDMLYRSFSSVVEGQRLEHF